MHEKEEQSDKSEPPLIESPKAAKQLDTLLNTANYLILGEKLAKVKVVTENELDNFPSFDILLGYGDDVIIGENIAFEEVEIYKKYNPHSTFEDYQVPVYNGELASPDFSSNASTKRFITRIKEECKKGINFAGHYTLVTWGCGSPCQSGVVVNRKTGEIFSGYGTALGSEFKKDSKMLIKNALAIDTTSNLIEACPYCEVSHLIWTGTAFEEVE